MAATATKKKRIVGLEVIAAGHNPDIDSDFRTDIKPLVFDHVAEIYGRDNVAHIITFGKLAAKSAFKNMCTIYQVPFAQANKIADLVPGPQEGKECTLADIFDPNSPRYAEGAEFRNATAGEEWKKVLEAALAIEGRYKSIGMHACGVIMSSKPLSSRMPLTISKKDGTPLTQWTYPECEAIGFLKFDHLGLDNVDLVQNTVEYIRKNGKQAPNMVEIAKGKKDDRKTYEVFQKGDTKGIFQFGSDMVRDYCRLMRPTEFDDLVATTALCRPGPMGTNSHVIYANRKNGREEVHSIHPAFAGSPLDTILEKTQGIIAYQEQIMQISNQIAGMTLQEGDELRSAMGKKKIAIMNAMRPKFFEGAMKNGYPEEAVTVLWDTIVPFAKYAFNKAHSVGYGMVAYQVAYLKANYPVEFMAALIAQKSGKKDDLLVLLQDARKMGLKIGAADINRSDLKVAPDYSGQSGFDIVYGLSGISSVSEHVAQTILDEREAHGLYTSVQDLINRCSPLGVSNRKIYENLALAGAFECFGASRRSVIESLPAMLGEAKTKASKGASLFDMFEDVSIDEELDFTNAEEYPYVEMLKKEAEVLGLYLTGHPLDRAGSGLANAGVTTIQRLIKANKMAKATLAVTVTAVEKKISRNGGKAVKVTLDDGTGYLVANLSRNLVKGAERKNAQQRVEDLYRKGETTLSPELVELAGSEEFEVLDDVEAYQVYLMEVNFRPAAGDAPHGARVNAMTKLPLADNGKLPIRFRYKLSNEKQRELVKGKMTALAKQLSTAVPGDYPIQFAIITEDDFQATVKGERYFAELAKQATTVVGKAQVVERKGKARNSSNLLAASPEEQEESGNKLRELPELSDLLERYSVSEEEVSYTVEYFDSGFTADKTTRTEQLLSSKFGVERVDFGVYNKSLDLERS